jgi:hypothetical protein
MRTVRITVMALVVLAAGFMADAPALVWLSMALGAAGMLAALWDEQ